LNVTSNSGTLADFDPRDDSLFGKGTVDAVFSRLRESDRLAVDSNGAVPIYSLVRYTDVARAYKEPDVFSPSAGLSLDSFDPAQSESLSRMLETAPPERHGELRSAMQGAFREPNLSRLTTTTAELLDRFLADSVGGGAVDFIEAFARVASLKMMAELLGVTRSEEVRLGALFRAAGEIGGGACSLSGDARQATEFRLLRDLTRVVRAHREEEGPGGLIGRLLGVRIAREPLTDHEVALNCLNVVIAGTGTSQHALAGAAAVWAQRPAELERVDDDPGLAPGLIDETLRWLTPVVHLTRIVTRDVEVSGSQLPRGAGVCLWNISANRDEEVFEEAHAFRPDRPTRRHLAFGAGPQHCLGAQIVRMQLDALLTGLLASGVRFELDGDPTWIRSNTITGVERLPLLVRRVDGESTTKGDCETHDRGGHDGRTQPPTG